MVNDTIEIRAVSILVSNYVSQRIQTHWPWREWTVHYYYCYHSYYYCHSMVSFYDNNNVDVVVYYYYYYCKYYCYCYYYMDSCYCYYYYSVLVWYCWDDGSNQSLGYWSMTLLLLLFVVSLRISMVCGFPLQRFYSMSGGVSSVNGQEWRYHLYTLVEINTRNEYGMENGNHRFPVLY